MVDEKTAARRQRRITGRKEQILDGAARVFAEKGFHAATTREIADAADVSEGTIYNYFASKEDLLLGIMDRLVEVASFDEMLDQSLFTDPRDFLVALLHFRYGFNQQHRAMIQAILSEILINPTLAERYRERIMAPLLALVEGHVQARIDAGQLRPVDTSLLASFFAAFFIGLATLLILGDVQDQEAWDALARFSARVIFDGLTATDEPRGEEAAG